VPELDGREMLMWGDMIAGEGELLRQLPAGVTVCEWGYDDWHPFDERTALLAECGVPFWVAPGTSSWLTILGRTTNAIGNCRAAALLALGDAHRVVTPQFPNMSTIVLHLYFPQLTLGRGLTRGLTVDELDTLAGVLTDARATAGRAASRRDDGARLVDELQWS